MSLTKQEKNKYPETYGYGSIEDLLNDPNNKLKNYVSIVDGDNHIRYIPCTEETKTGNKKRITKYKKRALPDVSAIKYLLVIHFGIEFNEKKAELELMARRLEKDEEEWTNEHSDETNNRTQRVRKQSKK